MQHGRIGLAEFSRNAKIPEVETRHMAFVDAKCREYEIRPRARHAADESRCFRKADPRRAHERNVHSFLVRLALAGSATVFDQPRDEMPGRIIAQTGEPDDRAEDYEQESDLSDGERQPEG